MQSTFEVTTYPTSYKAIEQMVFWCRENTVEFDTSLPPDEDESTTQIIRYQLDDYTWVHAKGAEIPFYFFNDVDAMHFKLRWSQYL